MSFFNPIRRLFGSPAPSAEQAWQTAFAAGESAAEQRNVPVAAARFEQALALAEKLEPVDSRLRMTLEALAEACTLLGDVPRAAQLMQRAVDLTIAQTGKESEHTATALNNLGCALRDTQDFDRARDTLLESLRIRETLLGRDHPEVATSLNNIAALWDQLNQPEEAERYFRAALGILQRHDRLNDLANVFDNLGAINMKLGKTEEAEKYMRHGLDAWVLAAGRDSWDYALSANNLARLYFLQKRYAEAEPLIRQTVEIAEAVFGPDHRQIADYLNGHASVLQELGRTEEAQALFHRADQLGGEH